MLKADPQVTSRLLVALEKIAKTAIKINGFNYLQSTVQLEDPDLIYMVAEILKHMHLTDKSVSVLTQPVPNGVNCAIHIGSGLEKRLSYKPMFQHISKALDDIRIYNPELTITPLISIHVINIAAQEYICYNDPESKGVDSWPMKEYFGSKFVFVGG
jgi:hypothetical protein